jgi:hypothetical protein
MQRLRSLWKGTWLILAICCAAFLLNTAVRLVETIRWEPARRQVDGEWLLATHDAYFWVAGAEGRNSIAEPMPMAVLLDILSRILPIPLANLAFWASILLAALVAIPIVLWGDFLEAPYAAFSAAVLASLAPAFYNRTRLGFYDSDWAALFFPLLIGWLLAVWIRPRLRVLHPPDSVDAGYKRNLSIPVLLILLMALALPWHTSVGLFLVAILGLSVVLVAVLGVAGTRSESFQLLFAMALAVATGWIGAAIALLLVWLAWRHPARFRHPWSARITLIALAILLLYISAVQFQPYLSEALPTYLGSLFGNAATQPIDSYLFYPAISASVRETQVMDLLQTAEGIAFHPIVAAAGVLGYLLLLRQKPVTVYLLPLLILGFGSLRMGIRFTIFGTPVVLLGLLVPLEGFTRQAIRKFGRGNRWKTVALLGTLGISALIAASNLRLPVETVLEKPHAESLKALGAIAEPGGMIWTWWDYGYVSQHYSGLETFADGRRNSGEYLFSLGVVLGGVDPYRSAEFMQFSAKQNGEPWKAWVNWDAGEVGTWLKGLGGEEYSPDPTLKSQYIIVQWEGIPSLPWIQYYGSWDFETLEGQRSEVSRVIMPLELDLETGLFRFDEGKILPVVTIDLLDETQSQHYDYPENGGGPHLLLNNATGEVLLLDERAYRSVFIQFLILPVERLGKALPFKLLIDEQPFIRVFALK